jgi:hypothetical protein
METKTVSLRLPQDVADYITSKGESITDGVKSIVTQLQRHERYADVELRGKFSPAEWSFLADSLNGTAILDDFRFSPSALVAHNQDAQLYDGTASKWSINLYAFNDKCASLTATQVEALYRRVERFWANCNNIKLEEWAKY